MSEKYETKTVQELLALKEEYKQKIQMLTYLKNEAQNDLNIIKNLIYNKCTHKKIKSYREYNYERPTYYYHCKICKKSLNFTEYCSISDAEIEEEDLY